MFEFTIDDGTEVRSSHFSFSATYSGLLEGDPSKSDWINRNILSRLHCPSDWGTRKTFLVQPKIHNGLLPDCIYFCWLDSRSAIDPEMHGSELVVIWLGDVPGERPIASIIYEGIRGVNWKQQAEDFQY